MPTDGTYSPPFDEQAALAELERLRDAIEATRRRRSQTSDTFEAFVRSFRTPQAAATPSVDVAERPQVRGIPDYAGRADHPDATAADDADHANADHPETAGAAAQASQPVVASLASSKRPSRSLVRGALGAAAILIAVVVLSMRPWAVRSDETPVSTGPASTPPSAPASTPAPAPVSPTATAAPAENAHAIAAELTTQRRVWVRVLVDGKRIIERELPPATRIPLQADREIVIRAGDAGALHMIVNGVDRGTLGKDSEIVTRTFTR